MHAVRHDVVNDNMLCCRMVEYYNRRVHCRLKDKEGPNVKFSQPISASLNFVINECLPPVLRDSRWFMYPLFRMAFGKKAKTFMEFREQGFFMTEEEYADAYLATQSCHLKKTADFSRESLELIAEQIVGEKVLDVGCGRGFLASPSLRNSA